MNLEIWIGGINPWWETTYFVVTSIKPSFIVFPTPSPLPTVFFCIPLHSGPWRPLQDPAVWQSRFLRSGVWSERGLRLCAGDVSLERGALLQGPGRLVGLLRAPQLQRPPVPTGERRVPQACGLGRCLPHCAVVQTADWVKEFQLLLFF